MIYDLIKKIKRWIDNFLEQIKHLLFFFSFSFFIFLNFSHLFFSFFSFPSLLYQFFSECVQCTLTHHVHILYRVCTVYTHPPRPHIVQCTLTHHVHILYRSLSKWNKSCRSYVYLFWTHGLVFIRHNVYSLTTTSSRYFKPDRLI